MKRIKRTKIVCTIGPASEDKAILTKMVKNGMNVARLNFSHGTHAHHKMLIKNIRQVAKSTGQPVAILQDLQGPKIRVGELPKQGIKLTKGKELVFQTGLEKYQGKELPVSYNNLHKDVKKGDYMLLDDGLLELLVEKVVGHRIHAKVLVGGLLSSHKGINLPDTKVSIPSLTKKDKEDLEFGIQQEVDYVSLSFVRTANEVLELRKLIERLQRKHKKNKLGPIRIIVKIEKPAAIRHFDAILEATDAVMIARGDLGIEIPPEEVPIHQKNIIEKCRCAGKPVIVATQMLDSMIRNPRATRAEVSDVANAVIDHADAIMLSGESATGKYPLRAVQLMNKIVIQTEDSEYDNITPPPELNEHDVTKALSRSLSAFAGEGLFSGVFTSIKNGDWAEYLNYWRPELSIFVLSDNPRHTHQMNLRWGLCPIIIKKYPEQKVFAKRTLSILKKKKLINTRDHFVSVEFSKNGDPLINMHIGL